MVSKPQIHGEFFHTFRYHECTGLRLCLFSQNLLNPVSFKLDDENFLTWRHQDLATIKAHKLKHHLVAEKMSKQFCTPEDDNKSEEFLNWEQQDQHPISWLLASMTPPFANRMVGCDYAFQIWAKVEKHFASQTRAKVCQLRTQLKAMKKDGSASKFLLKVKKITDSLADIGAPISVEEHIEVILDGLGREYAAFIISIVS